jgi:hypothetical protein
MLTDWSYSTIITQYAEIDQHIPWKDNGTNFVDAMYYDNIFLETTLPLLHISRTPNNDLKMKTWFLKFTGFSFNNLPVSISGLEAELGMNREGRVTDETVQLTYNNMEIGKNQADFQLDMFKLYGGSNDLWDANLTNAMISDPSFGIILRFQSHPSWPHKSTPMVDYIRLRVY